MSADTHPQRNVAFYEAQEAAIRVATETNIISTAQLIINGRIEHIQVAPGIRHAAEEYLATDAMPSSERVDKLLHQGGTDAAPRSMAEW